MPELPKYLKAQYFNIVDNQNGVQADQNCLWKKDYIFWRDYHLQANMGESVQKINKMQ